MYCTETKIRIRYSETDQMGYVYHGNYAQFYEIGRTEMFRSLGISYKTIEESGIMLPVISLNINYKQAAKYDDLITIKTKISKMPSLKVCFDYEIYNENKQLINTGNCTLVCINSKTRRPCQLPEFISKPLLPFFEVTS